MARTGRKAGKAQAAVPSTAYRLGSHFTISAAIAITDFGVALTVNSRAETEWSDVAWMAVHALAIATLVFLWFPLSAWAARRVRLSEAVVEGLMVLALGLLVAGVEFGLLRGTDRVAHTVVAVVGLLAGWAMRIPPPQPREPQRRKK